MYDKTIITTLAPTYLASCPTIKGPEDDKMPLLKGEGKLY